MKDYTKLSASEKEALVKKASESAYNYEKTYGSCAQSCLGGLRDAFPDLGVTDEMFKTSYGLAGGCGCCLEGTCGALSGAAMAISILNGRDKDHRDDDFSACYDKIKKVIANFRSKYGVTCRLQCSETATISSLRKAKRATMQKTATRTALRLSATRQSSLRK